MVTLDQSGQGGPITVPNPSQRANAPERMNALKQHRSGDHTITPSGSGSNLVVASSSMQPPSNSQQTNAATNNSTGN